MKKMILGLVMVVMMLSCVGCGKEEMKNVEEIVEIASENEGFVPEIVSDDVPIITGEVSENIEGVIDENNLEKYYDCKKYLGTPHLVQVLLMDSSKENDVALIGWELQFPEEHISLCGSTKVKYFGDFSKNTPFYGIVTDNNTPDDGSDDLLVYIFTTPIQN